MTPRLVYSRFLGLAFALALVSCGQEAEKPKDLGVSDVAKSSEAKSTVSKIAEQSETPSSSGQEYKLPPKLLMNSAKVESLVRQLKICLASYLAVHTVKKQYPTALSLDLETIGVHLSAHQGAAWYAMLVGGSDWTDRPETFSETDAKRILVEIQGTARAWAEELSEGTMDWLVRNRETEASRRATSVATECSVEFVKSAEFVQLREHMVKYPSPI